MQIYPPHLAILIFYLELLTYSPPMSERRDPVGESLRELAGAERSVTQGKLCLRSNASERRELIFN